MLSKLKTLREDHENGFTLIELLVVILIIGILASIAIPVFLNQRKTANDAAVESDVKNASLMVESWIVGQRGADTPIEGSVIDALNEEIKLSEGVTVGLKGTANSYCVTGSHTNGKNYVSDSPLTYDSEMGGLGKTGGACLGDESLPGNGSDDGVDVIIPIEDGLAMIVDPVSGRGMPVKLEFTVENNKVLWYDGYYTSTDGSEVPVDFAVKIKDVTCADGQVRPGDWNGNPNGWMGVSEWTSGNQGGFNIGYDGQFPQGCNAQSVTIMPAPSTWTEHWTVDKEYVISPLA